MIESVLAFVMLTNVTMTSYRSVENQTDNSPFITSIGHRTHPYGIAVSQDLLEKKIVEYGDAIYIEGIGIKVVNDCLHKRHKNHIDVWVATYEEEKAFHKKWKGKKVNVFVIKARKKSTYDRR